MTPSENSVTLDKMKKGQKKRGKVREVNARLLCSTCLCPKFYTPSRLFFANKPSKNYTNYHLFSRQPNHCALHWNQFPKFCFNVWTILRNLSLRGCKGRFSASLLTFLSSIAETTGDAVFVHKNIEIVNLGYRWSKTFYDCQKVKKLCASHIDGELQIFMFIWHV